MVEAVGNRVIGLIRSWAEPSSVVPARPLPLVQTFIASAKFPLWSFGMSLHLTASYIPCEAPT